MENHCKEARSRSKREGVTLGREPCEVPVVAVAKSWCEDFLAGLRGVSKARHSKKAVW